jgi:hypothetical protein
MWVIPPPEFSSLSSAEKDALITTLLSRLGALEAEVAAARQSKNVRPMTARKVGSLEGISIPAILIILPRSERIAISVTAWGIYIDEVAMRMSNVVDSGPKPAHHYSARHVCIRLKHAYHRLRRSPLYCSFCGKSQHDVRKLVAGPHAFICDECVELCMAIFREESASFYLRSSDEYRKLAEDSVRHAQAAGITREQALLTISGRTWVRLAEEAAREAS